MNKELEALLLSAAKAIDYGVVGVSEKRAHAWGVPVGKLVRKGEVIPGHSKKAKVTGYYCPYSVPRPESGLCLMVHDGGFAGGPAAHYELRVLREDSTGESGFRGRPISLTLREMKAYLRGIDDGSRRWERP